VRQAVFDMLWHAPWAGRAAVEDCPVLDAFAGSGAMGLEALSRGASQASFLEQDRVALAVLRQNVVALGEEARCTVMGGDVLRPRAAPAPCGLVFLDPPYGRDLVPKAVAALAAAGWIAPDALLVAEVGREEALEVRGFAAVAEREHGAARVIFLREG
jgi:16S rRNA (guanine966-N2)-methyltransferase